MERDVMIETGNTAFGKVLCSGLKTYLLDARELPQPNAQKIHSAPITRLD
jgi:hypothetical protein